MGKFKALDWLAIILTIIGGINWGLVGLFGFDLVAFLFGMMTALSRIIYILVGLSALYMIALVPKFGRRSSEVTV
jgi:uncharacterized protein